MAAKLAVGYTLDQIANDITQKTPASFEPSIDYVVTKVPRFAFEKFPGEWGTWGTWWWGGGGGLGLGVGVRGGGRVWGLGAGLVPLGGALPGVGVGEGTSAGHGRGKQVG